MLLGRLCFCTRWLCGPDVNVTSAITAGDVAETHHCSPIAPAAAAGAGVNRLQVQRAMPARPVSAHVARARSAAPAHSQAPRHQSGVRNGVVRSRPQRAALAREESTEWEMPNVSGRLYSGMHEYVVILHFFKLCKNICAIFLLKCF